MFNKNHIITGIAIVAVIGGGIFFMSRNNSSSDVSSLEHGTKNLTREYAAKMIDAHMRTYPELYSMVESVEVTGISEPAQGDGGNTRKATLAVKYNEKIYKGGIAVPMTTTFMLYDDGWRLTGGLQ